MWVGFGIYLSYNTQFSICQVKDFCVLIGQVINFITALELPYSTEFGRDSRQFASGVRKYGKFSHFLTHLVIYGGQGKKQIVSSLSTANVYRLSHIKVSGTYVQPFQRYWGFGVFEGFGVFWGFGCWGFWGVLECLGFWGFWGV